MKGGGKKFTSFVMLGARCRSSWNREIALCTESIGIRVGNGVCVPQTLVPKLQKYPFSPAVLTGNLKAKCF